MIAIGKCNQCRAPGVIAGDLDGIFYRLAASREKQGFLGKIAGQQRVHALGQRDVAFVWSHLKAGMGQAVELILDRVNNPFVAVADILASDSAAEIDIALALDIPDLGVFGPVCDESRRVGDRPCNRAVSARFEFLVGRHVPAHAELLVGAAA